MSLLLLYNTLATAHVSGPQVSPSSTSIVNSRFTAGTTYANLKISSDGIEYENTVAGNPDPTISRGAWLDAGSNDEVWVERILDVGTLSTDPGSGRLSLALSKIFGTTRTTTGSKSCTVTFNYYDAASGGNLIGSATVFFNAIVSDL